MSLAKIVLASVLIFSSWNIYGQQVVGDWPPRSDYTYFGTNGLPQTNQETMV